MVASSSGFSVVEDGLGRSTVMTVAQGSRRSQRWQESASYRKRVPWRGTTGPVQSARRSRRGRTRPYQFSLITASAPADVLERLAERPLPGISVAERGESYIVLSP